jgi:hypothetical protein
VFGSNSPDVKILNSRVSRSGARVRATLETNAILTAPAAPVAILPMRLNVMGSEGLVVLAENDITPFDAPPQPNITFHVTALGDSQNGTCSTPSGSPLSSNCTSLRAAILASNASFGQDLIVFDQNGTITLSVPDRTIRDNSAIWTSPTHLRSLGTDRPTP